MALSAIGRKHLLEHGKQRKIALRYDVSDAYVSSVVRGEDLPKTEAGWKTYRKTQRAIARTLGLTVEEAFQDWERGEAQLEEMSA